MKTVASIPDSNQKDTKSSAAHVGSPSSFFKPVIQTRLSVNEPGDSYEQEADAMADKVMHMAAPHPNEHTFFKPATGNVQRKCHDCEEEEKLHRKESSANEVQGGADLDSYVGSLNSSGSAMPEESRKFFEPRFGQDFSNVRIHNDSVAASSAQSINALAYTTGNNIVFNRGQFAPESDSGKKLMAHELTHVVQQKQGLNLVQKDDPDPVKAAAEEAAKKAALIKKIKTYGIISVEDGSETFTSAQLDLVDKAISGLPVADKAAIKGAKIIRVTSLSGGASGMYTNTQGNDGTVTDEQKIELSNAAFDAALPAAESIRVITHEVGHAIAAMPHRVAMTDEITASVKSNKLVDEANVAVDDFNTATDASNAAIQDFNDAATANDEAQKGTDADAKKAAKADLEAKRAIMNKLKADRAAKEAVFNTKQSASDAQKKVLAAKDVVTKSKIANIDDFKNDATAKLAAMQAAYTSAGTIIQGTDADSADYRAALTNTEDAIQKFYDENVSVDVDQAGVDAAKAVVDAAIQDRNTKRDALNVAKPGNPITSGTATLESAQESCFKAAALVAYNKTMNLSVRKFYDLVIANAISPALTPYAAANWPNKPEEFYAEAYSFFVTRPADLQAYSKVLFDWFKAGNYK